MRNLPEWVVIVFQVPVLLGAVWFVAGFPTHEYWGLAFVLSPLVGLVLYILECLAVIWISEYRAPYPQRLMRTEEKKP